MNKRTILVLAFVISASSGLLLFRSLSLAVHGDGIGDRVYSKAQAPLLQVWEVEPNDSFEQANPISINLTMVGLIPISQTYDVDWFSLSLSTADVGRRFEVRLEEMVTNAAYKLDLCLFDADLTLIMRASAASSTTLDWTAAGATYYLRVTAAEFDVANAPGDLVYELTVMRLAPPPPDYCEINDKIDGVWPGGPCPIPVGRKTENLDFIEATGQPVPNDDYYTFRAEADRVFRIIAEVSGGADTEMWLFDPFNAELAYDDNGGLGLGSSIELTLGDGYHKVLVRDKTRSIPPSTAQSYSILVKDVTPALDTFIFVPVLLALNKMDQLHPLSDEAHSTVSWGLRDTKDWSQDRTVTSPKTLESPELPSPRSWNPVKR